MTRMTVMTGTTMVTCMTKMTGRSWVTVMDRVTRMTKVTCSADGKKFPKLLLTDLT